MPDTARRTTIGRALLVMSALALTAAPALAKTVSYSKSASSGKTQKIDSFFGWKDDCSFQTIDLKIVKQPANGSVSPKVENSRISAATSHNTSSPASWP